jgi:AcrR family transcriptional regulator
MQRGQRRRLGRGDWQEAALDVIREGGLDALAVEHLARRLGVTKGSFYWHFHDRDDLLAAALGSWADSTLAAVGDRLGGDGRSPEERLAAFDRLAAERSADAAVELQLTAHADDPRVGPHLQRVMARRLELLGGLFAELGCDDELAQRHALHACAHHLGLCQLLRTAPEAKLA